MESVFIGVGILAVLTVVTLRQDYAAADDQSAAGLAAVGDAFLAMQEWTFNLGPAFVVGVGNGCILGCMMCRTGLVPRRLAMFGLVGGPLIIATGSAAVLGLIEPGGPSSSSPPRPSSSGSSASASTSSSRASRPPTPTPPSGRRIGAAMIAVDHVTKTYGDFTAVDDVTFTARPGRITGFLGPNGAGKSTTLRVVVGLTPPDHGTAHVQGRRFRDLPNPGTEVGVLLDASAQHAGRTGREVLTIAQRTMGLPAGRIDDVLDQVGLDHSEAARRLRDYSLGMRQRLGLAHALLGDPDVLILDEPANGLDPAGIRWMRDLLRGYADRGATVLLSSHLLHEIEVVADDLVVIGQGRVVAAGTED